jgi:hypothetical protein
MSNDPSVRPEAPQTKTDIANFEKLCKVAVLTHSLDAPRAMLDKRR